MWLSACRRAHRIRVGSLILLFLSRPGIGFVKIYCICCRGGTPCPPALIFASHRLCIKSCGQPQGLSLRTGAESAIFATIGCAAILRPGAKSRPYKYKADTGQKISSLHALSARIRCASARAKKDRQMTVLFVFLFLFFFVDGDGDAEVGKLKVIDRGGALGHRFGRVLHFRIGNHVTKRLRLQHLHAKPVKP